MKCVFLALVIAAAIYFYIDAMNGVIATRLLIPQIEKEVKNLNAENERLRYEIDRFKSPSHLMELLKSPEFSHLKPDVGQIRENDTQKR